MPLYLQSGNLIVRKQSISEKYEGGLDKFRNDFSSYEFEEDDELINLISMGWDSFFEELIENGLEYRNEKSSAFVIKNRYSDYSWKVDWIEDNGVFFWDKKCEVDLLEEAFSRSNNTIDMLSESFFNPISKNRYAKNTIDFDNDSFEIERNN